MSYLDASLVLAFLLRDEDLTDAATDLLAAWREAGEELIAPPLLSFEVQSGLRLAVCSSRIIPDQGDAHFPRPTALDRTP